MGKSYYLACNGDDSSDGLTSQSAWRTLSRAAAHAFEFGDSLLLQGGDAFEGTLEIGEGPQLTIATFGDGRAMIVAGNSGAIAVRNRSVSIENIEAIGGWGSKSQSGSEASGIVLDCALPDAARIRNVVIQNVVAQGFKQAGIEVRGGGPDLSKSGFEGVLIEQCETFDNGGAGIVIGGNMAMESTDWCHRNVAVRNCVAHHNRGISNRGSHSGSGIVISDIQQGVIEGCVAYENGELNDFEGGGPVGIWCWDCDRVTIQHCEAYHNRTNTKDGGGFDLDGGCTNCVLQYNYSHDNAGPGILICQFREARPFHHNVARFNLCVDDGRHNGGGLVIYDDWDGIADCDFYHNTFISSPSDSGTEVPAPLRLLTHTSRMRVFNNIFMCRGDIPIAESVPGQEGLEVHDNVFFNPDGMYLSWNGSRRAEFEVLLPTDNAFGDPSIKGSKPTLGLGGDRRRLCEYLPGNPVQTSSVGAETVDLIGSPLGSERIAGAVQA